MISWINMIGRSRHFTVLKGHSKHASDIYILSLPSFVQLRLIRERNQFRHLSLVSLSVKYGSEQGELLWPFSSVPLRVHLRLYLQSKMNLLWRFSSVTLSVYLKLHLQSKGNYCDVSRQYHTVCICKFYLESKVNYCDVSRHSVHDILELYLESKVNYCDVSR